MAAGHFSPALLLINWPYFLYSSRRKCWYFFQSGHYVPSTQCKIKWRLLWAISSFPSCLQWGWTPARADLHLYSWDCAVMRWTTAHVFPVLVPIPLLENNLIFFSKAINSRVWWALIRQCFLPPTPLRYKHSHEGRYFEENKNGRITLFKKDVISPWQCPTAFQFFFLQPCSHFEKV